MKVAELREKAKEFEIETTGKKKAELVEEIYTTAAKAEGFRDIKGILQIRPDSSGIIHAHGYMNSNDDAFVPAYLIRSARLRTGDVIGGLAASFAWWRQARRPRQNHDRQRSGSRADSQPS